MSDKSDDEYVTRITVKGNQSYNREYVDTAPTVLFDTSYPYYAWYCYKNTQTVTCTHIGEMALDYEPLDNGGPYAA